MRTRQQIKEEIKQLEDRIFALKGKLLTIKKPYLVSLTVKEPVLASTSKEAIEWALKNPGKFFSNLVDVQHYASEITFETSRDFLDVPPWNQEGDLSVRDYL